MVGQPMNPEPEKHLRQRLADGTDDERLLYEKLVAIEFQQPWVRWQSDSGQLIDVPITIKRKTKSGCHQNVATIWRRKQYDGGHRQRLCTQR
jgi:hypothetical protein